jgi:hypothetical protein
LISEFGEEISTFKNLSMVEHSVIKKYLNMLLAKYWKYATPKHYAADKCSTRVKLIQFFNLDAVKEIWVRISEKMTSNRMDKVFLKKLISLKKDYGTKFDYFNDQIDVISNYFARTRNLGYYLKL